MSNLILDQARGLRKKNPVNKNIKVIAVTGGKGGIGKTNVSLNTAYALAEQGKRVCILDADLGLGNVDVMLGLRARLNLSHVLRGEATLDDIIIRGPRNIGIIPATSGSQSMVDLSIMQQAGLIRAFSDMQAKFDFLIVDTAAGISDMVLSFSRASQDVILVVCDEPTSITDAYALIKILSKDYDVFRFKVVTNMVTNLRDGRELFDKLSRVTDRFLNVALELVGIIPYDEHIRRAAKKQMLVVDAYPDCAAAVAFKGLANKIVKWPIPALPGGHLEFFIENLVENWDAGYEQS